MIGFADDALKDEIVYQSENVTKKILFEPKGVVLALLPWDFPVLEIINVVVPSIICGNSVLLKDNTVCPIFSILFEESLKEVAPNLI
jgi:succinate-semialdehyde dehydrogenase/glutarate-semialdehyde dehydrogenase